MKVYFIGCGPGDKDLLTLKAKSLIEKSDVIIYAGSLIDKDILSFAKVSASLHDSAKLNLDQLTTLFNQAKEDNKLVARLHSGDTALYGAINEQIAILDELNIDYEVVPGVSSFLAAAASLKTELTAPDISQSVIITRISGKTKVPEAESLSSFAKHKATICIFLSIHKIDEVVDELLSGYTQSTPIAVGYKASRSEELIIRSSLGDIAKKVKDAKVSKTALIIVGEALNNKNNFSKLYDKKFAHMFREAAKS